MEIVNFEESKVVYLTSFHRPAGQLYSAEAVMETAKRYSFMKAPTFEEIVKRDFAFGMGKFKDVQINSLSVYADGLIANSASRTEIIADFLDDLMRWMETEFGVLQAVGATLEVERESVLVVKAETDLAAALAPKNDLAAIFNRVYRPDSYIGGKTQLIGYSMGLDAVEYTGRRKPVSFMVERRIGRPFKDNIFLSSAPLNTKDHLEVLRAIERLALAG